MSIVEKLQKKLDELSEYTEVTESKIGDFLIYKNDNVISKAIRLFGEYCHAEVDIISKYVPKDGNYIDIGTNIGYHAVAVHKATDSNVLAFEPNFSHFAVASYNAKQFNKIQLINAAASDHDNVFKMKTFDPSVESNYGDIHKSIDGPIEVQAIKLDQIEMSNCHFIKYDVEGHEFEALQGSTKIISKYRPVIMYEAMEWDVWTKCYDFLNEREYLQYWVPCKTKPLAETYKKTEENPFGDSTIASILSVPKERNESTNLMTVVRGEPFTLCFKRYKNLRILF